MTTMQRLKRQVLKHFPMASVQEEQFPSGSTWLDVRLNGTLFVVEHRVGNGFGVSELRRPAGMAGYGDAPDRFFSGFPQAQRYLLKLLGESATRRECPPK